MSRPFRILSLDGGGIRGIIPAAILCEIEKRTDRRISECFDLIAGTSTGGILGAALVSKKEISAKQALDIYLKQGGDIFKKDIYRKIFSLSSLSDNKYDCNGIDEVLFDNFGKETIEEVSSRLLVSTYDMHNRESYFFKSWRQECNGVPLTTVCRSTSAAPTYFEPVHTFIQGKERTFIDGGIYMNNPAVSAYVEAIRIMKEEETRRDGVFMLSLGTGQITQSIAYGNAKNWGKIEWIEPLLDCMFDGASDAVDYQMGMLLGSDYVRIQHNNLDAHEQEMDNVDPANMKKLKAIADKYIKDNDDVIDRVCKTIT